MKNEIKNLDTYINRMTAGMEDKLFFMDWIQNETKAMIDYGCADGALIEAVAAVRPDLTYYGYDINNEMIARATARNIPNAKFYSDWISMCEDINKSFEHEDVAINLSSVIHEIYSYSSSTNDVIQFWCAVSSCNWGQIFIRDMMIDVDDNFFTEREIWHLVHLYPKQMAEYEYAWGSCSARDIVHFLLKYRYIENWERELKENYSPLDCSGQINGMLNYYSHHDSYSEYHQVYGHQYLLPYIRQTVLEDTGIDLLGCTTHYKAVFNRY